MSAADTVLFAIQGGLQLYGAVRKAYADSTRGRPLVLPLPRSQGIDWTSARTYFRSDEGRQVAADFPRAEELVAQPQLTEAEKDELTELYRAVRSVVRPGEPESDTSRGLISAQELSAVITVRQWSDGKLGPEPTALQQIAGTVVNLSIDFFLQSPHAISDRRPEGRALRSVLEILDRRDFATEAVAAIAPDLLIGVLDSVAATPELWPGGDKERLLVDSVVTSFTATARDLLAGSTAVERADAAMWLQAAARAVIRGGAATVLANPVRFFDASEGDADLLSRVGGVVVELVAGDERLRFRRLLSGEALDAVVKAILASVAQNPGLLKTGDRGIGRLLADLAGEVAKLPDTLSPDLYPELARRLLQRTAENLDLIWGKRFTSPERHLLLGAVSTLLSELSRNPPSGSSWRPALTREQVLRLADGVMDEVTDNPQWVLAKIGANSSLGAAVRSILASLRGLDSDRVSADTGIEVFRAALAAASAQPAFLRELPVAAGEPARLALAAVLDTVFGVVFGDGVSAAASWKAARGSALEALVRSALEELARVEIEPQHIDLLRQAVTAALALGTVFDAAGLATDLRRRLGLEVPE